MITLNLLWLILIPIVNYILYSFACYLDSRFDLKMENKSNGGVPDPFNMIQILLFGFLPMMGIILLLLCIMIYQVCVFIKNALKLSVIFSMHEKLKDLGKLQHKQANDPDYQAEKYLLGKK